MKPIGNEVPGLRLIRAIHRTTCHRGSDVRIMTGDLLNPDAWPRRPVPSTLWSWKICVGYQWQSTGEHINVLELRAYLSALKWRLRKVSHHGVRFLHLLDSQVCIAIAVKGRSSSFALSRVLDKVNAVTLAGNIWPALAYVQTWDNPADKPSRWRVRSKWRKRE